MISPSIDRPAPTMAASDDLPDSWEVADVEASMSRLLLTKSTSLPARTTSSGPSAFVSPPEPVSGLGPAALTEDLISTVDQFLREALQNPRERVSVLRLEQDVIKFIQDPNQQQMEFQQLPTSYLRLAAHRVAQHYSLQSMVLVDSNLPESSGSRIIVRKSSVCRLPLVRLADIPVSLPGEGNSSSAVKVAIKQRPQKRSQVVGSGSSHSPKANSSRSVEERKEEYNRARARIFSASNTGSSSGKPESQTRTQEPFHHASLGISKAEDISIPAGIDLDIGRFSGDSSTGSSRAGRGRAENEPVGRVIRSNSKVAIFRDREVERKDPDYDRSYDRYAQRFDPGFGFNGGSYPIQPLYAPVLNYNTEFPQLGSAHRSPISADHQSRSLPQHLPGTWVAPSSPAGIGYGPPESMITPYSPNHMAAHSASNLYMQYPVQRPGMAFIHPREQLPPNFSQTSLQSHQQQSDASFGLARPR